MDGKAYRKVGDGMSIREDANFFWKMMPITH